MSLHSYAKIYKNPLKYYIYIHVLFPWYNYNDSLLVTIVLPSVFPTPFFSLCPQTATPACWKILTEGSNGSDMKALEKTATPTDVWELDGDSGILLTGPLKSP